MSTSAERVARGAEFLDEHFPGWWEKIDVGTLNISDYRYCVLGQMFPNGHFGEGIQVLRKLNISEKDYPPVEMEVWDGHSYIFAAPSMPWLSEAGFYRSADTDAWIAAIKFRFEEGTMG